MSAIRTSIRESAAIASLEVAKSLGIIISYYPSDLSAISLYAGLSSEQRQDLGKQSVDAELVGNQISIPIQPGIYSSIYRVSITSGVAQITTRKAHGFLVGQPIRVEMNDANNQVDGIHKISSIPSSAVLRWATSAGDFAASDIAGSIEAIISIGDKIVISGVTYKIASTRWDSFKTVITVDIEHERARRLGVRS